MNEKENKLILENIFCNEANILKIIASTVTLVSPFIYIFTNTYEKYRTSRVDDKLTKELNRIMNLRKDVLEVRVLYDESLNAYVGLYELLFSFYKEMKYPIYVHSGLIKSLPHDGVMAILLHEAGHLFTFAIQGRFLTRLGSNKLINLVRVLMYKNPFFQIIGALLIDLIIPLIEPAVSKKFEDMADSYAVKYGYGEELASAFIEMKKRSSGYGYNCSSKFCNAVKYINKVLSAHPELEERIERILGDSEISELLKNKNFKKAEEVINKKIKERDLKEKAS